MVNTAKTTRALLIMLSAGLIACGDGVLANGDGVVYFTPWNTDTVETRVVDTPGPTLSEENAANYAEVRQGFAAQAPELLARPDVVSVLGPIEQSFLLSGDYPQLVEIYRQQYEEHGTDSVAAIGLAWTYLKLGNQPAARAIKARLLEERPNDPLTWVIVGNVHIRDAESSIESARRARDAFERVLELDPNFTGFKSTDRNLIQRTLEALNQRIPEEPVADPEMLAAAPMHHTDDEAGAQLEPVEPVEPSTDDALDDELDDETDEAMEPELVEAQPVDEPDEPDEHVEETDEEQPSQEARASHHVVFGQQALQRGSDHLSQAHQHFSEALRLEPEHVDAHLGMLRVERRSEAPDEVLSQRVDTIADQKLTAQQAYELGLFCLRRLNDRDRATSLLQRVQQKDPSFARRVGVDSLLDP